MKTLYISDLDGTLLNKNAKLSQYSENIINELIDKGMIFSVATARSQSAVDILKNVKINTPCVQLNGVLIYDFSTKEYIDCTPMDIQTAREVVTILRDFDRMSFVYKFDKGIVVEFEQLHNPTEVNFFNARKDNDYKGFRQVEKISVSDEDKVIYFTMVDSKEKLQPIYEAIEKVSGAKAVLYHDNYSDLYFLEVFSVNATKANGVRKMKEITGADKVVAFGDNLNDIDMLKFADTGIAVKDSVEDVKKAADLVIGSSDENGVAEYLKKVFDIQRAGF